MAHFKYRGRDGGGGVVEGVLEGNSRDAVASQLMASGIIPVDIAEHAAAGGGDALAGLRAALTRRPPELEDLILFSRQMYTLLRAGVPINQAMAGLARSTRNEMLVTALGNIRADLESGREFSTALGRHGDIFPSLFVNTVRVGENTGRLDDALLRLAEYLELERDTRARIKSALRYPSFVVIAIGLAVGIINVVVVPQFARIFERAKVELPLATRILIGTSDFFVAWWPMMIVAVIGGWFGARAWIRTPRGRYQWDRYKLRLPVVGSILYRATLGRFARSFSMSLASGVPLLQALSTVSRAIDNDYVGQRIAEMRTGIERGDSLTRSAAQTGMFSPLVLQMLSVGEESGAIDDLLAEVASFYEREVDYDIKNLAQAIEPILIVVMAGLVLILALGVFLPMWDMAAVKIRN
ncbi:MAG: type II secretion system F family protein [Gammaproteobacteria bacterium]